MKIVTTFMLLFVLAGVLGGCGVMMTGEYSRLLDETAALSNQTATMAENSQLTSEQKTASLRKQADTWAKFQDARDGKK
ncbi:MAG: hypothetical protein HZA50_04405 [Planctomycetes bacterium]|nr:hypothetical protein [Planctomycetota bacterium]